MIFLHSSPSCCRLETVPPPEALNRSPLLVCVHGFGSRARPRGLQPSLASYGRWLAEAAIEQAQGRPLVLIGHSLGGSLVVHAAPHLGDQLAGVVQVAAGGGVYQPRPFRMVRRGGAAFLRWRPSWLAQTRARRFGKRPTGSRDTVMEPRYVRHLAGYSREHRFALLDGEGHLLMRSAPQRLAALINSWLKDQSLASPRSCNSANCA